MYIKYFKNIHNVSNFYSILKGKEDLKSTLFCINLLKHDGNHISLAFKSIKSRDFILDEIWKEIEKGSRCYDIDAIIDSVYDKEKFDL